MSVLTNPCRRGTDQTMANTINEAVGWLLMQPSPRRSPAGKNEMPSHLMQNEESRDRQRGRRRAEKEKEEISGPSLETGARAPISEDSFGTDDSLLLQELENVAETGEGSLAREHLAFLQAADKAAEGGAMQKQLSDAQDGVDADETSERERANERESQNERERQRDKETKRRERREERDRESPLASRVRVLKFWNEIDARRRRKGRVKGEGAGGGGGEEGGGGEVTWGEKEKERGERGALNLMRSALGSIEGGGWKKGESNQGEGKEGEVMEGEGKEGGGRGCKVVSEESALGQKVVVEEECRADSEAGACTDNARVVGGERKDGEEHGKSVKEESGADSKAEARTDDARASGGKGKDGEEHEKSVAEESIADSKAEVDNMRVGTVDRFERVEIVGERERERWRGREGSPMPGKGCASPLSSASSPSSPLSAPRVLQVSHTNRLDPN